MLQKTPKQPQDNNTNKTHMLAQAAVKLATHLDEVEHVPGVTDDDKSLFYKFTRLRGLWKQKNSGFQFEMVLESICECFMKSSCSNKQ